MFTSTRFRSFSVTAIISAAVIVISSAATACTAMVADTFAFMRQVVRDFATGFLNCAMPPVGQVVDLPKVERVQARAFVARLLKRERPQVTAGWRMCPST